MSVAHNNNGLFSDHYLKHRLPELSGEALEQARADQQALREIYEAGVPIAEGADEQVCEQRILRPALARLGFEIDAQPTLRTVESTFWPDHALFANREALEAAIAAGRGSEGYYELALAVGEAKRYDRDLGSPERDEDAAAKRQHPGAQIRRYLLDSNVRWGILTNGKLWRIYERERSRAGFRYYEVDLPALIDADIQHFRYFWLLFRRDSFIPDDSGASPIEQVYEGSRRYWLGLTDRLRGRVYDALEMLMTGMIEGSSDLSEDDLPAVHEASLIVLYRLLFCFYAEARDLLPVQNDVYRDHHAAQTKLRQVAERRDTGGASWPRSGRVLWQWFRDLSRIINDGDPDETGVPEYDGGLFDPEEWPLLGDPSVAVPDVHMAEAIDRIGRDWDGETDRRAFLDYSELTVRELGSIYEGLLEMRPHFEGGEVELLTDRGERKATGSYYTPEYIVDYIVTNTLDPLLTDAAAQVASRLPDFEARIAEQQAAIADRPDDHPENLKNLRKIDDLKLELLEPYFELMVLDPAMGSGHFLVAASEEITEAIITDPSHLPPADAVDEDDENIYYKRRVVERCLYGVDLNPLAVELAKLSLWLHTVEFGKPLSFLKHHLREGNSLIGARLAEMHRLPNGPTETSGQLNLFTQSFMPEATRMLQAFGLIEHMPTDTLVQEREKEAAWEEIERRRERFRQVANVWLSTYFGNTVDDADYARAVDALGNPSAFEDIEREEWFTEAGRLAAEHSFFHWELEFPDAFFTEQGPKRESERGFDAVVGNPPWGPTMASIVKQFAWETDRTISGPPEKYRWFMSKCVDMTRDGGRFSMIVPNTWLSIPAARHLRTKLLELAPLEKLLRAPASTFPDVSMNPCVFISERRTPSNEDELTVEHAVQQDGRKYAIQHDYNLPIRYWQGADGHVIVMGRTAPQIEVANRLQLTSCAFGDFFHVELGAQAYHNTLHSAEEINARIYHAKEPKDATYMPEISGTNVGRYEFDPTPQAYLSVGDWLYLVPDRPFREEPRILVLRVTGSGGGRIQATYAQGTFIPYKALLIVTPEAVAPCSLHYGLAVLNSSTATYWHLQYSDSASQEVFPQLSITELNELPIRIIDFEHPTDEALKEEALKEEALGRCREAIEAGDYETPFELARAALAAHATAHGPAGKAELREDDYWAGEIEWLADGATATTQAGAGSGLSDDKLREDMVHDLLAWLAQRMIDLNERKHEEKQGFLRWLERTLGCEIDDLQGKTLIRAYDDRESIADFDDLCSRLQSAANRRQMTADPQSRATQERVEKEYEGSMEKLDALNASLAATDALIDRIVYALYGLGDEEIAIIEG